MNARRGAFCHTAGGVAGGYRSVIAYTAPPLSAAGRPPRAGPPPVVRAASGSGQRARWTPWPSSDPCLSDLDQVLLDPACTASLISATPEGASGPQTVVSATAAMAWGAMALRSADVGIGREPFLAKTRKISQTHTSPDDVLPSDSAAGGRRVEQHLGPLVALS